MTTIVSIPEDIEVKVPIETVTEAPISAAVEEGEAENENTRVDE